MPAQNLPGMLLDSAHPLSRGLVGWWPMNEGGGNNIANVAQSQGCAVSVATDNRVTGSIIGTARTFGTNAYATAPGVVGLPSGSQPRTMMIWARFPVGTAETMPFGYGVGTTANHYTFYTDTLNRFYLQVWGTSIYVNFAQDGKWHFWATTYSGPTLSTARIYKDGANQTLDGGAATALNTTASNLTFGGKPDTPTAFVFNGGLAHARIYNRVLSDAEISQLYADPLAGARAPVSAARYFVPATISPPAAPPTADRLWNRGYVGRIFRRGEKG